MKEKHETESKSKRIYENEWFWQTVNVLKRYQILKKRIEIIKIQLRRDVGPDTKVIAKYGIEAYNTQNPVEISKIEVELEEKEMQVQAIEKSFEVLDELEFEIIKQKFKHGYYDRRIYEVELPMSSSTFYEYYNRAITKIAKCLGLLAL